ncbi:uridine kinase [Marinomonas rhizomae]|uniref:uridine kinase n=1 Tax=Marinomonas rhizomae TaxID=491948 RepID=UPI0021064306|nr:uridine kinase [Marinomonas rhizomae]UTV99106.1 uridine kinase [Marinomonas rhizomae]
MLIKIAPTLIMFVFTFFIGIATLAKAESDAAPKVAEVAELFGLPLNDLSVSQLNKQLNSMGLSSYPSYKDGAVSYSLGPEGILGVTNATIYSNGSGYVRQALLSGVVESKEKRKALGDLLTRKYGNPSEGALNNGIGRSKWLFTDGTMIELHNTTYDVSLMYVDGSPKVVARSGQIDVEALSRKNQ